jgi:uncharacterized protein (TIGR02001 family)
MKKIICAGVLALLSFPALAEDTPQSPPKALTLSGSASLVSDYRFRGVSQSDNDPAIQGGITATHASGVYAGFWASGLAGWGTFGGANMELDLVGGYKRSLGSSGLTIDVGLTWYMYPGGAAKTDFAEPYVKLGGTLGPVSATLGIAYAPQQQALGNWSATAASRVGDKEDNLYLWGDAAIAVPGTRFTGKAHLGHSNGNPGLGPNGTSVTPTGAYWDWSLGVDYQIMSPVSIGVAYIDTNISKRGSAYLLPNFSSTNSGKSIAGGKLVASITAAF